MHFGIYTETFLLKYLPKDEDLRAQKLNRITVFLVFKYYGTSGGTDSIADDGTNEIMAYELGGIEP